MSNVSTNAPKTSAMPCWCGSDRWAEEFRTPSFGVIHCSRCGVRRIDPVPISRDDQAGEFYTSYYGTVPRPAGGHAAPTRSSRFWRVASLEPDLDRPGDTVIDVGCGDGGLCGELQAAGWRTVYGLDVAQGRVAKASSRYPGVRFHCGAIQSAGIPERSADLIVMDNVIEHLPQPSRFIAELMPYLKPTGRIVLLTPNMESGCYRFLGRRWTPELAPHAHIYLFTAPVLEALLGSAGYQPVGSGNFHLPTDPPASYLRRIAKGDLKGAAWKLHQELGALYGRMIREGPMIYAIGSAAGAR